MDTKQLGHETLLYFIGNISIRMVSFLLLPFYTRYLTTSEYGIAELLELVINVTSIILGLGTIGSAMIRIYHDYLDENDRKNVISTTLIMTLVLAGLASTLGISLSGPISKWVFHASSYRALLVLAFFGIILSSQIDVCLTYIRMTNKAVLFVIYSLAQTILMVLLNIYFIGVRGLGVWGFVYSKVIVFSLGLLFLLVYVYGKTGISFSTRIMKELVRFGYPLVYSSLAFFVIHFVDRFFISNYSTLDEVGIYSLGYKFGFLITFLVGEPFGKAWNVRLFAHTNEAQWQSRFSAVFAYLFGSLLLVWTGLSIFSRDIIDIMASQPYAKAALIIPVVAFAYVLRECGDFFKQLLFINKRASAVTIVSCLCAVINLVTNFALIRRYGMYGAMVSTVLTWGVYTVVLYVLSQKEHRLPYRSKQSLTVLAASIGLFSTTLFYRPQSLAVSLIFHTALMAALFLFVWKSGFMAAQERTALLAFVRRKLRLASPAPASAE